MNHKRLQTFSVPRERLSPRANRSYELAASISSPFRAPHGLVISQNIEFHIEERESLFIAKSINSFTPITITIVYFFPNAIYKKNNIVHINVAYNFKMPRDFQNKDKK